MKEQIISIAPDGTIYGLDFKSKGVSLRDFGECEIERVTSIEWNAERQKWFIKWTCARHIVDRDEEVIWTDKTFSDAGFIDVTEFDGNIDHDESCERMAEHDVIFFEHYEDANAAEVAVIQSLRLHGKLAA